MIPREIRDIVDVTPVGDAIEHELSDECPCGPSVEAVFRPSGSNGWLRSHHSLDGRERFERTERGGTMSAPREYVEAVARALAHPLRVTDRHREMAHEPEPDDFGTGEQA